MKSKLKLCLSALRDRGTQERLTLKHQPKSSLRKPLSGSLSNEAGATRSLGSSKICPSGTPSTVPSFSLAKKYLWEVESGRWARFLKLRSCCSWIKASPALGQSYHVSGIYMLYTQYSLMAIMICSGSGIHSIVSFLEMPSGATTLLYSTLFISRTGFS
jgi:hypothetical protein